MLNNKFKSTYSKCNGEYYPQLNLSKPSSLYYTILRNCLNWQDYNLCNYLFIRYLQLVFSHFFLHKVMFSLDFRAIVFLNSETEFF